jgi:hypothetical protein
MIRAVAAVLLLFPANSQATEVAARLIPTEVKSPSAPELQRHARALDKILVDAALDLGLTPQVLPAGDTPDDAGLSKLAVDAWLIVPKLKLESGGLSLHLTAVAPSSDVLLTRVQRVNAAELEVRAVVMLQELIQANPGSGNRPPPPSSSGPIADRSTSDLPPPSAGRAVLALNTAVFGGYVGFTAHRASGSADARLLYPLTALGAGLGLGASMLVADEWNITEGSAWYLSAGQVWPTVAGIALGSAYDDRSDYRHLYGLLGATSGLALATTAVSLSPITPGHAALAHSGGAFGTLLGGLTEALIDPELSEPPLRGVGYGSALGAVALGALAPSLETSASRVLFVDLSAGLGALTGAALASPVVRYGTK